MKEGIDITDKRVSGDEAINDVISARAKLAKVQRELAAVTKDRDDLLLEYNSLQKTKYPAPPKPAKARKTKDDFVRIVVNDVHGQMMDHDAVSAFLTDLKQWDADEIVLNGDIVECGGFLAAHHALGYVAQTEYSWQEDIAAGNWFLDQIQKAAPKAVIHYTQGNHEDRVERWIVDQTMRHSRDAEFLRTLISPEVLLKLEERGVRHYSRGVHHIPGLPPGWIKLGKIFFVHELAGGKNAARDSVNRTAGNVVYAHCFSEDTEVLCKDGWKLVTEIKKGEEMGTIRLDDAAFEWQRNTDVFVYDHYNELVHVKNTNLDILVTEDHALVTLPRSKKSLESPNLGLRRVKAKDLIGSPAYRIPLAGRNTNAEFEELSDDELRFFVWVIAEGTVERKNNRNYIRIAQSDTPNGGMAELDALLGRLGVKFSKKVKYSPGITHGIHRNYTAYCYTLSKENSVCEKFNTYCPEKHFEDWLLKLSARQFNVVFDTMMITDGNKNSSAAIGKSYQYSSKDLKNVDLIQAACAINSIRTISTPRCRKEGSAPVFCISICKTPWVDVQGNKKDPSYKPMEVVPYSGKVACCSVPNQTLVLRRNGKVFVAGNTHVEDTATTVLPGVGLVKAFNPGCLCQRQPLWRHSNPTGWSHGYAVQFVSKSDEFLHINIPIWSGRSLVGSMHGKMKG